MRGITGGASNMRLVPLTLSDRLSGSPSGAFWRMNNLLRTLTESHVRSPSDLKILLTAVKDTRRQNNDGKISDLFYDSLEGLLLDLRTVTMDNRDAEAFLKPVSRTDVPDYYDVISNPMDLQTMLKKVKTKQYKSKREFKDDLDLIWSNCFLYNATENHPLRQCAQRLKVKADILLKNITDRKERTDPSIPFHLTTRPASPPKVNGILTNGRVKHRSPTVPTRRISSHKQATPGPSSKKSRHETTFSDTPAIIRSAAGMSDFRYLDTELDNSSMSAGPSYTAHRGMSDISERLRSYIQTDSHDGGPEDDHSLVSDYDIGEKRKLNGVPSHRPRKRSRLASPERDDNLVDMWWHAVQSDFLLANGLPSLLRRSSENLHPPPDKQVPVADVPHRKKRRRRERVSSSESGLLALMNNNIKTMKRVRRTHIKFAALNMNADEAGSTDEPPDAPDEDVEESVDERPWKAVGSGIEMGEAHANDCLRWMSTKVLEHVGFQGTSSVALDVLTGVASEFLLNVGRALRFLCDKYTGSMTAEEILLHTLFESGTTKISDLERYIKDDVIRYGSRLGDLEKKLVSAYREATAVEAVDDEALFGNEEDEEDEGALVMGNFADSFGEDFLGLRELGIAAEFGLSSLSIPKKLLKGKSKAGQNLTSVVAKPSEPPPPYPPPPPFVLLDSKNVDNQIGLLKPYYLDRISQLSVSMPPISPAPPPPFSVLSSLAQSAQTHEARPSVMVLSDDPPNPAQVKMGPLGQIIKGGASVNMVKKKSKAKEGTVGLDGPSDALAPLNGPVGTSGFPSEKKRGPKKKSKQVEPPSVAVAGTGS